MIAKRQKVDEMETGEEAVLFNSDTLSNIISYLLSLDLLNLGLTCKRFGVSDDNEKSVIKMSADTLVHEVATEEQLAALPRYDGESPLADYHYLQLLRAPLMFDQLVGDIEYVNSGDKSCVIGGQVRGGSYWKTAISNNILRAGKHYATFEYTGHNLFVGVMRPGQANQRACGYPCKKQFFQNFSPTHAERYNNNNVHCCLYYTGNGASYSSNWLDGTPLSNFRGTWDGREGMPSGDKMGMLLDLDEGTLSVYKNRRKLGVMKRGLAGPYCWAVSIQEGVQVTIKRGTIPQS
jgi:hypothetical protein